ncbi:unnamed protein product [Gulo gulo]|uniref:Uncharacterized protein n=1 Tax=Gulo gulo TaxID=48420 RepID=A0A9X9LDT9_GULGU|nr:unnamed protein product [Gulo gulo]
METTGNLLNYKGKPSWRNWHYGNLCHRLPSCCQSLVNLDGTPF